MWDSASRLSQREAMAKRNPGAALDRRRHAGGGQGLSACLGTQAAAYSQGGACSTSCQAYDQAET